jgi:hypothetical protein
LPRLLSSSVRWCELEKFATLRRTLSRQATLRARQLLAAVGVVVLAAAGSPVPPAGASVTHVASSNQQLGFNSYVQDLCQSSATWASDASGQFAELKSLGTNSIALAFPLYMSATNSDAVFARTMCDSPWQTPSPARLAVAINEAHALGLKVMLRPLVQESTGNWIGRIRPENVGRWFASYLAVLTPYLELAQQLKVEHFAIATELDSLVRKRNWAPAITVARRHYRGDLVFTVPWGPGQATHAGTTPGLDAYQGVRAPTTATPAQLLADWNHAASKTDPLPFALSSATIDEVAIPAQDGAYATPWVYSLPLATNPFDQSIQANWYSAACSFFKVHRMKGIYFWGVWYSNGANAVLATPGPGLTQEVQPESAAVIQKCYTGT